MSGVIPPLPNMPLWRGTQLKYRDNFNFLPLPLKNLKVKIYKTIILPVVLYGYKTLPPVLSEEHRLKVFEKGVLRRMFGPKREEELEGCRRLHNEELHKY
jgi:hypothetical protein